MLTQHIYIYIYRHTHIS